MMESEWEIVETPKDNTSDMKTSNSDWEVVSNGSSTPMPTRPNESFGQAAYKAPFRIAEDLAKGGYGLLTKTIPEMYQKSKTELPGVYNVLQEHPGHALKQLLAGLPELGHNILNLPHNVGEYAANRLNLIPESVAEKIPYQQDIEPQINAAFGTPQYPGENLLRGIGRNALNLAGAGKIASVLNPMNLTTKGIAKNVVAELKNQQQKHTKMYNSLWKNAEKQGFNKVPIDNNLLNSHYKFIKKFYPEKSTLVFKDFLEHPTLQNAQKAQSDLGNLRRQLEEKSQTTPLLGTEKYLHESLADAEKHIEGNMFKNALGENNAKLANRYKKISTSYRENVVPYRYNSDIQDFMNKKLTSRELVQRLNKGEFAAQKAGSHPALGIRNTLAPFLTGAGTVGGGLYLLNHLFNNPQPKENLREY